MCLISRYYSVLFTFSIALLFGMYSGTSFVSVYADVPENPSELKANVISSSKIDLSWTAPDDGDDNNAAITGYKIEMRTLTDTTYQTLVTDTKSTDTKYSHTGLESDTDYFYRVYAINSEGTSDPSSEDSTRTLDNLL